MSLILNRHRVLFFSPHLHILSGNCVSLANLWFRGYELHNAYMRLLIIDFAIVLFVGSQ